MRTYTADAQTLAMQHAALERVRAMQRRGQSVLFSAQASPQDAEPAAPAAQPPPEAAAPPPPPQASAPPAPLPAQGGLGALLSPLLGRAPNGGGSLSSLGDGLQSAISAASQPVGQLLDSFGVGGEELMILLVMYAIFRERGDPSLLLALGYLLL